VLGWCAVELLAESIDAENPARAVLDMFDRLRLREPFVQAFHALGFEGEEGWRAAARIKVLLLAANAAAAPAQAVTAPPVTPPLAAAPPGTASPGTPEAPQVAKEPIAPIARKEAEISSPASAEEVETAQERPPLAPSLWRDADVRWLTGVHESEGLDYLVREPYEELLWWLQMPSLLRLAGEAAPSRAAAAEISRTVENALAIAASAGFRVDALLGEAGSETSNPDNAVQTDELEPEPCTPIARSSKSAETP
jgi:hypothetical protein